MNFNDIVVVVVILTAIAYSIASTTEEKSYEVRVHRALKAIFWMLAAIFLTLKSG